MFVFLSHSTRDKAFVRRLTHDLEQERIAFWIDEIGLHVGDNLTVLESKIREAGCMVVILSLAAQQSAWVRREIEVANSMEGIRILPVLLEDIVGGWGGELAEKAIADFRNPSEYRRSFYRLISAIKDKANPVYLTAKEAARLVKTERNPSGELFGVSQQGVGILYAFTETREWIFADATSGASRLWIVEFYDSQKACVESYAVKDGNIHELPTLFLLGSDPQPVENSFIIYSCLLNEETFYSEQEAQEIRERNRNRFSRIDKRYTRFRPVPITRQYVDSDKAVSRAIECSRAKEALQKTNDLFTLVKLECDKRHGGFLIWSVSFFDPTLGESILTVGLDAVTGEMKYPAMRNELLNANFFHFSVVNENYVMNFSHQFRAMENHVWDIPLPGESTNHRLTAGEAINLACELLDSEPSKQRKFGFLSNTGVVESVVSPHLTSAEEGLMKHDGTAGQWVIEVHSGEPQTISCDGRKGYAYEFKQILVTREKGAVAVNSSAICMFTVPLSRCPLPDRLLDAYEKARTLAVRYAAIDFSVMSVALDRFSGGAEWRFRFYDSEDMLLSLRVSGDGTRVIA